MVKAKRPNAGGGEFTGFAAFASHTSTAAAAVQRAQEKEKKSSSSSLPQTSKGKVRPNPLYTGNDTQLSQIFKRIAKKDPITKSRALMELSNYAFPCSNNNATSTTVVKSEQITSLCHYFYLFSIKLLMDNNASVRTEAVKTFTNILQHVPKAALALMEYNVQDDTIQGNVVGWIYSLQQSQIGEEKKIAQICWHSLMNKFQEKDLQKWVILHLEEILNNSSRAVTLTEALSIRTMTQNTYPQPQQKQGKKKDKKQAQPQAGVSASAVSEAEKEEMEERFERVILVTLRSCCAFLQENPDTPDSKHLDKWNQPSLLWKHIGSIKSSFRRSTYQVVSCIAQFATSLLHNDMKKSNLPSMMVNILASEKDQANFPPLLEMILLYIMSFKKVDGGIAKAWDDKIALNQKLFCKNLGKVLKRACYGANAPLWAPTILPILATLGSMEGQQQILSSLWSGRTTAVGQADSMSIVSAVAECAMFILVQKLQLESENENEVLTKEVGQQFLDCVEYFLMIDTIGSAATISYQALCATLVRDLCKLDSLGEDVNCRFLAVRDWFWSEGLQTLLGNVGGNGICRLTELLMGVQNLREKNSSNDTGFLKDTLKTYFRSIVCSNISNGETPKKPELSLTSTILKNCSLEYLFKDIEAAESWCESAVIPLILTVEDGKSSTLNTHFELVFTIISELSDVDAKKRIWEKLVLTISESNQKLDIMIVGLKVLLTKFPEAKSIAICDELDSFAIIIATNAEKHYNDHSKFKSEEEILDKEFIFLQLVSGVIRLSSQRLISLECLMEWVNIMLGHPIEYGIFTNRHILLEVLLSFVNTSSDDVSEASMLQLLLRSWQEGGKSWDPSTMNEILSQKKNIHTQFIDQSSTILQNEIRVDPEDRSNVDFDSYLWAGRAARFMQLLPSDVSTDPLQLIGMKSISMWRDATNSPARCEKLYLLLLYMLEKDPDHIELVSSLKADEFHVWLAHVLIVAVNVDDENSIRCRNLLHLFSDVAKQIDLEACLNKVVEILSGEVQNDSIDVAFTNRGIMVLDFLVGHLFSKLTPKPLEEVDDNVDQSEVKEGDEFWYVSDGQNENSDRLRCTIMKIHTDDFPNLYFTVSIGDKSKQTIAARLKKHAFNPSMKMQEQTENIDSSLLRLEDILASKLIQPCIQSGGNDKKTIASELLNTLISFCGLQGKKGIGSTRFEVYQIISKFDRDLLESVTNSEARADLCSNFQCMATLLGRSSLTSTSHHNVALLNFDSSSIYSALEERLRNEEDGLQDEIAKQSELSSSILKFLSASASTSMDEKNVSIFWELLDISSRSTSITEIITAIENMNDAMEKLPLSVKALAIDSKESSISNLIKAFCQWNFDSDECITVGDFIADEELLPEQDPNINILDTFRIFIQNEITKSQNAVAYSARENNSLLFESLSSPSKRRSIFNILSIAAKNGGELCSNDDVDLAESTEDLLNEWIDGLEDEEAVEIEDDVYVTAQWLPTDLMTKLESWKSIPIDPTDEDQIILCLLCWNLCLDYFEAAGKADMRNRAHISSYIEKLGSVNEMFSVASQFCEWTDQDLSHLFDSTSMNESGLDFDISKLSTLSTFRSIELMPTLCKTWWSDDCPKALRNDVSKFVETMVAPETLKRELLRIEQSSSLGELEVNGSCISREVVANYIQDECKLSVVIKIPPSFPLRNAQVDCQRTLGISEKRWRFWSLLIMRMLNSQDGSVLDALLLWKQNVDKEFEGVEPCPVCYSVLCVKTHAMPNLECKTCNNRFHSGCLYKWFSSSGKNQCVLCQQPWSGTKVA